MIVVLYLLFVTALVAFADVSVSVPLEKQLPLIARVNTPYSWTFSRSTFVSSNNSTLVITGSSLPAWLSLDPSTLTLHGTPSPDDEGTPDITITASEDGAEINASSGFSLCVTSYPAPSLNIPIGSQLYASNPSLSSVFLLTQTSALVLSHPGVRIPHGWSFSIGFEYDTVKSYHNLYYAALQADGSPLPSWMHFSPNSITFNGVAPSSVVNSSQTIALALHASDQEGYSAMSLPFDVVVASHELSLANSTLPTINITASMPFSVDFSSPADFAGVHVDGNPIQPEDVVDLTIDTSHYAGWLHYDKMTRTLSGQPPDALDGSEPGPVLPVELSTFFNQTVYTNVSLAIVPSFFSTSSLNPITAVPGQQLSFDLVQYFSNKTTAGTRSDVNLSASFDPSEASEYLNFDSDKATLLGTIPDDDSDSDVPYIAVTFTAYSHITHSTSHTNLNISLSPSGYKHDASHVPGLSDAAHAKLMLALEIAFGIMGGVVLLGVLLAGFRQCAKLDDTAVGGEEGTRAWSEKERKWYGMDDGIEDGGVYDGYGWTDGKHQGIMNGMTYGSVRTTPARYGSLGRSAGYILSRVASKAPSHVSSQKSPVSNVMRKDEFLGKLKATVRHVSDKYTRVKTRPVISKPSLVGPIEPPASTQIDGLPNVNTFEDVVLGGNAGDDVMTLGRSVSSSTQETGKRSIPRRRADFVPVRPAVPHEAHKEKTRHDRVHPVHRHSTDSIVSLSSVASHETQAVVHTATKAMSMRSARSVSGISYPDASPLVGARPRLVPFTSAARVPIPMLPSLSPHDNVKHRVDITPKSPRRVVSQKADVVPDSSIDNLDDLSIGVQYVRALGEESGHNPNAENSVSLRRDSSAPIHPSSVHFPPGDSAFSLESSDQGDRDVVPRMLLRTGEFFKFPVAVSFTSRPSKVIATQISGKHIPKFFQFELKRSSRTGRDAVEFWGTPRSEDIGEFNVGLYAEVASGECIGRVIVEIVRHS